MQVVKTSIKSDFETEPIADLEQIFAQYGLNPRLAQEIRSEWDDPEDILDIGGGEKVFLYARVFKKGKEHFTEIVNKVWQAKHRKSDPTPYIEKFWDAMSRASQDESSLFA